MIQKLKILLYLLFGLMTFIMIGNIVFNISDVVLEKNIFLSKSFYPKFFNVSIREKLLAIASIIGMLSFCTGVFFIMRILKERELSNYFSQPIITLIERSGHFVLFSGVVNFCIAIISLFLTFQRMVFPANKISITLAILSIIIGVFLLLISKVLAKAQGLKLENDLTI
ncbi:DUF2975 domain-containing protein [Pseudotenacibaculum sp. MALMAid0570]|uniref:DUF2975 domain-containing protein n=1 Tax=Pseudotenacibaculum sp. MALMAid0570 TaxID=3143938 RepID=UPI0032DFA30F